MQITEIYFNEQYDTGSMHERVALSNMLNTEEKRKKGIPVFVIGARHGGVFKRPGLLRVSRISNMPEIYCSADSFWDSPECSRNIGAWHYIVSSDYKCGSKNQIALHLTWEYALHGD